MDISAYYSEILKHPLLTKEEEQDLFLSLEDNGLTEPEKQKIRDKIINANLRYGFKIAKRYSRGDPDEFSELIAAANLGLMIGFQKFDPKRGYRFLTYAGQWVFQSVQDRLSKFRVVSLPTYRQQLSANIQKVQATREDKLTLSELKVLFPKSTEKDLLDLSENRYLTYYLSDLEDEPDFEIDPISDEVHARMDREKIIQAIESLDPKKAELISLTYGIHGEELKQTEIAKRLNLSKEQLRQLKKEGLEELETLLKDHAAFL
jgi:RNA polymerase sigma factor (sigma-70 family)